LGLSLQHTKFVERVWQIKQPTDFIKSIDIGMFAVLISNEFEQIFNGRFKKVTFNI
jgi:hypothetical protein